MPRFAFAATVVAASAAALVRPAAAPADAVAPAAVPSAAWVWIAAGAPAEVQLVTAPRASRLAGPRALAALGAARAGAALPAEAAAGPATSEGAWTSAAGPFGPAGDKPAPVTVVAPPDGERVAALRWRRTFTVGAAEAGRVAVLALKLRYLDAAVVKLNGREVARRNLAADAEPATFAQRVRGSEWESFWIDAAPGLVRAGENVLEIETRPHARRAVPTLDVSLEAGERRRVVRGPMVQRVGRTRATVVVETDGPVPVELRWGTAASKYDKTVKSPKGTRHVFELEGLPAGGAVHYQIVTLDETGADLVFHTAPAPGEPLRVVVYGDVRSGHATHARMLDAVAAEAPDLVLTTGDMVNRGTDEADWQRFFALAGPLVARVALYPAIGNHDAGLAAGERHLDDIFALPPGPADRPEGAAWYAFDFADLHIVVLDSNRWDDPRQVAWLENDLMAAQAAGARAIIAVCHHGPWSRGPHGGSDVARETVVPVLERHGVAVIFSGHDHLYQRGKVGKLHYVVTGGGGAGIYKPRCGVAGKPKCKVADGMKTLVAEHHYVLVEVLDDELRMCPRRADGTGLEKCATVKLPER